MASKVLVSPAIWSGHYYIMTETLTMRMPRLVPIPLFYFSLPPNEKLTPARAASSFDEAISNLFLIKNRSNAAGGCNRVVVQ